MTHFDDNAVTPLLTSESWTLLESNAFGRVVLVIGGRAEIFPVNFVVSEGAILFRTAEGTKLFGAVLGGEAVFESDSYTDTDAWSVILRGTPRVLKKESEIARAEAAGLQPWIPTVKNHFVVIEPSEITGRRFEIGPEPEAPLDSVD